MVEIKDVIKNMLIRECENCGSKEDVKKVLISSFTGPRFAVLCPKCQLSERMKKY